ncbi:O-antigen polymerase [Flavobacterium sp. CS20]|uniref:O-antigen polymerase n=1 Tax=Flavobacterium sp. CS20 TaxID=2775246 RepID=UPI001B3A43FD|nr:O-antigen polymerase [Flavobacterium sp. CS20]QTY26673.1 oligosaccharide repeat unit polymerase [Flavobacterium sp. CS20]
MNRIIQLIVLLISILIHLGNIPVGFDSSFFQLILFLTFVSLLSHFFIRKEKNLNIKKQYFKISVIFIITFCIAHFQIYIDYLLGNVNSSHTFLWINNRVVSKALSLSSLALISYIFFYDIRPNFDVNLKQRERKGLKNVNIKLLNVIASILLLLYLIFVNKAYLFGGYGNSNIEHEAGYFSLLFESLINAIIILNCRNIIISNQKVETIMQYIYGIKFTLFLLIIYLISVMISGDRGPLIYNSVFVLFGYIYVTKKKISVVKLSVLLVLSAFIITILGIARRFKEESNFITKIQQANNVEEKNHYYPESFSSNTRELASTARTLNLAVESEQRFYGLFALQDLMLLIPMLKGTFINFYDIPKPLTSSAQFLTFYNLGSYAS